ncbi:MAG: hypothetical protein E6Q97_25695 [Desulfurellales bacterium]|nr:MAG: hypothetical protein E6Q97_25695 [Desulfurellales bacterium]
MTDGKWINTPGAGGELLSNGDFGNWTAGLPNGWEYYNYLDGTRYVEQSGDGCRIIVLNAVLGLRQGITLPGKWYRVSVNVVSVASGSLVIYVSGNLIYNSPNTGLVLRTARGIATTWFYAAFNSATSDVTIDNVSVRQIPLSDLLSLYIPTAPDVSFGADLTVVSGTQAGLALNWDSSSSPANGVIAYIDGDKVKLEKCVAGVWTTVITAPVTYSANARLSVSKTGTQYQLHYNGAPVGSANTISDVGIVNNTRHGLFSTYEGNILDNCDLV